VFDLLRGLACWAFIGFLHEESTELSTGFVGKLICPSRAAAFLSGGWF
jgi:hypothetical protein